MEVKITYKDIKSLIPADYNPRQMSEKQYEQLKESINKFGLIDPLIININEKRNNVLVGGHQRYKICSELGYKEVPCVGVDLTPERERELNIRLNKNTGGWDFEMLANQFDIFDLYEYGFTEQEMGFDDIDSDEDIQGEDGHSGSLNYLSCGKVKIPVTDEEVEAFSQAVQSYVDENTVSIGFLNYLLKK